MQIVQHKRAIHRYASVNWLGHLTLSVSSHRHHTQPASLEERLGRLCWIRKELPSPGDKAVRVMNLPADLQCWDQKPAISEMLHGVVEFKGIVRKHEIDGLDPQRML